MEFSFKALTKGLSPDISVGCGLKTSSISFRVIGSRGPSPSVSVCSVRSLDSLSSLRSEVKTLLGRFPKDLLMELTLDETGLGGCEGVLRPEGEGLGAFGGTVGFAAAVDVLGVEVLFDAVDGLGGFCV